MGAMHMKILTMGLLIIVLVAVSLGGCVQSRVRESSSMSLDKVIESARDSRVAPEKSSLLLPASVAILVVPGDGQVPETVLHQAAEKLKQQLLQNKKYIRSVSIVSSREVTKKITLEQVRTNYGADVIILIFYHQDQRSEQNSVAGLLDGVIIPQYIVPGVKVRATTLVEGVVAHIPSNAVIFRTSVHDEKSSLSTSFSEENVAAKVSVKSFKSAMLNFGKSLSNTLDQFEHFDMSKAGSMTDLLESSGESDSPAVGDDAAANDYWKNVDSAKAGGGAFGFGILLFIGVVCVIARLQRT